MNARHEEAAVHIAEGYARIARKPAVVIGNPACGTGNMLAGRDVSAHGEGHPVVAIGTLRPRIKSDPNRGGAWQAADTESMARPITKYAATVRQWERLPEMVRAAFRAAMTGRPGPAYLAIPDELLAETIDDRPPAADLPGRALPRDEHGRRRSGGDRARGRAARERASASYVHAGKGVLWADGAQRAGRARRAPRRDA